MSSAAVVIGALRGKGQTGLSKQCRLRSNVAELDKGLQYRYLPLIQLSLDMNRKLVQIFRQA